MYSLLQFNKEWKDGITLMWLDDTTYSFLIGPGNYTDISGDGMKRARDLFNQLNARELRLISHRNKPFYALEIVSMTTGEITYLLLSKDGTVTFLE